MKWLTRLLKPVPVYTKGSNPYACIRYPNCELMCTACDIEQFNKHEETLCLE